MFDKELGDMAESAKSALDFNEIVGLPKDELSRVANKILNNDTALEYIRLYGFEDYQRLLKELDKSGGK